MASVVAAASAVVAVGRKPLLVKEERPCQQTWTSWVFQSRTALMPTRRAFEQLRFRIMKGPKLTRIGCTMLLRQKLISGHATTRLVWSTSSVLRIFTMPSRHCSLTFVFLGGKATHRSAISWPQRRNHCIWSNWFWQNVRIDTYCDGLSAFIVTQLCHVACSYTMFGEESATDNGPRSTADDGIVPRLLNDLLMWADSSRLNGIMRAVRMSFVEIYREAVRYGVQAKCPQLLLTPSCALLRCLTLLPFTIQMYLNDVVEFASICRVAASRSRWLPRTCIARRHGSMTLSIFITQ